MTTTDFFKKEEDNQDDALSKIKLGEKEYTEDELSKLVGLGELAVELETKWNTPLNKVVPEFTKKSQRLAELEPEFEKLKLTAEQAKKQEEEAAKAASKGVTPEEMEKARKAIFDILGYEPMNKSEFDTLYAQRRQGEEILQGVESVLKDAQAKGKPSTDVETVLKHMQETGIKSPEKAYKDLFEDELEKWKDEQLKKAKPTGYTTQPSSSAGSKQPTPVRATRDNLRSILGEVVNRE